MVKVEKQIMNVMGKGKPIKFQCMECGAKFSRKVGPRTVEVECRQCGSYDVEPVER